MGVSRTMTAGLLLATSLITPGTVAQKPPAFFLAGDSTTAVDGGWGDGFLAPLVEPAWGLNFGLSGATTDSFVAKGRWANVTEQLREYAGEFDCFVTISFGHNDQKPENNVPFAQRLLHSTDLTPDDGVNSKYQQNLIDFANEVKSLGGTPLLTSSLTRRVFPTNSTHNATDSLHAERLAALAAAEATSPGSIAIDLNAASLSYINAIGRDAAWVYNWGDDRKDMTHLNPWGEVVFGRMVADLVLREVGTERLGGWIEPNKTLSEAIWNGLPA